MDERAVPTSAEVATAERDVLLATKLYLPRLQASFVPRPRLTARLDDALAGGMVLVCAPAGFGKTALLGDWAPRGGRAVGWLSLDAGDSDAARFWRHVVAALDRARPGLAARVEPLLGPPAPRSFDGLVTALINELAAAPADAEILLVLDDYHVVDSAAVHTSLMFLLEHLPPGMHVVLASRADPPLALARLRARGQLAELRAAELRFTSEEAAALLRAAVGAELSPDALMALEARTEGWAAGLQLAALSLRGQADAAGFVATFSGSHRYVLDYLTDEVLERQTEQVRRFLLETSVLERLSGELCDMVTGGAGGQTMLETVEAAGLFLVPLDEVRGWWRYHHLFADLLRARLRREQPSLVSALHRNAAGWYDEHGLADDAFWHALAAGDTDWAARLIERHFDAFFYLQGEGTTVERWLAALPAEVAGARPRLLLVRALLALAGGRVEAVDNALDAAERASSGFPDEPFEPTVGPESWLLNVRATVTTQRAYLAALRGDAERTASFAAQALAEIGEHEWMAQSVARWNQALAEWLRGRPGEAERVLTSTSSQWRAAGDRGLIAVMRDHLGQVQRAQGRLNAAHDTYQETLMITAPAGSPALPGAGAAHVGLAELAYERNLLDTARKHLTEGIPLCRQFVYTPSLAAGLVSLARIRQARGDPGGAWEAMDEAAQSAPGPDVTVLLNPVPTQRARLQLVQGDIAAAARWTQERSLSPSDEPSYPREPEHLVLARVLLAEDRPAEALALLERLHAAASAQCRTGSVIEIRALQALALNARGDDAAALAALADALESAAAQAYVRVFADEGAPMAALLRRLIAAERTEDAKPRGLAPDYLARLLRAFEARPCQSDLGQSVATAVPGLVAPLTARELEVLGLLTAGRSNPSIAEELVITLDTVKKHVGHILDKLGASNRTEAVTRAQRLGLIARPDVVR